MKSHVIQTIVGCFLAFMLIACNKDQAPDASSESAPTSLADPIQELRTFHKHLEQAHTHSEAKDNTSLSLEQALWDVENHFNLTYTDAEQYHTGRNEHEFYLYLPLNGNHEVSMQDAIALYEQAVDQARQVLSSEKAEQRVFLSLNIKEMEESDGMVRVCFSGKTGDRANYNPPQYHVAGPFGTEDNWMFATPLGKCDDPDIPSGADEQLQEKLFDTLIGLQEAAPGYRNVYLNRRTIFFDGSNYPGVYYNEDLEQLCIPYYDMNLLFKGELNVISWRIPQQYSLEGYQPISININGIHTDDHHAVTHLNEIEYGIRHQVRIDEFGEVEPLIAD